jgi:DNA-binding transcriptional regulator YiaG
MHSRWHKVQFKFTLWWIIIALLCKNVPTMNGRQVKKWMAEQDMSVVQLAAALDVCSNTIYKWLRRDELTPKARRSLRKLGCNGKAEIESAEAP